MVLAGLTDVTTTSTSLAGTWGDEQRKKYLQSSFNNMHNLDVGTGRVGSPSKQSRAASSLSASRDAMQQENLRFSTVNKTTFTQEVFDQSRDKMPTKFHRFVSLYRIRL
jgi:hypothetical protein